LVLPELKKSLGSHLQKIREEGFDHAASSQVVGITDIGVPVLDSGGAILAAMTVSSFRMKGDLKEERSLVPILQACARRIADRL
jgi:DNA-binding IclR family transcriptional regulator